MPEERRLAAIMFTDIVGYTALMGENEPKALQLLERNRKIQKPLIEMYHGQFLKEMGDGILASFNSVSDAVHCAQQILKISKEEPDLKLHIGIHLGEVIFSDGDVFGDGVNIASRIESSAKEGEIYISEVVWQNIKNKEQLLVEFVGKRTFKNVKEPVGLYRLKGASALRSTRLGMKKGKRISSRQIGLMAVVVAVVIIVFFLAFEYFIKENDEKVDTMDKSIAVLPFRNDSQDTTTLYFCNGIMEDIINQLVKIKGLDVVSRTDVEPYRNASKTIKEISRELGVAHVLEGSVRKQGNKFRLSVQLINPGSGFHLWSETYDRDYDTEDIFATQSEIAQQVAASLNVMITPEEKEALEEVPTSEIKAYDYCLRGWENIEHYWSTMELNYLNAALHFYDKALEIDPNYVRAVRGKAQVFFAQKNYDSFLTYVEKVIVLDPDHHWGYYAMGEYFQHMNAYDSAIAYYSKAIERNPNAYWTMLSLGVVYCNIQKDVKKGMPYIRKAMELVEHVRNPAERPKLYFNIGVVFLNMGDYERAERFHKIAIDEGVGCMGIRSYAWAMTVEGQYKKALQYLDSICPLSVCGAMCLGLNFWINTFNKQFDQATTSFKDYSAMGGVPRTEDSVMLAYVFKSTGRDEQAIPILENTKKTLESEIADTPSWWNYLLLSQASALLDKKAQALEYLSNAVELGLLWGNHDLLEINPLYENLWDDPAFKSLVKRAQDEKAALRAQVDDMVAKGEIDL